MCLLLAAIDVVAGHPLVCLANRDEYYDRAARPPASRGGEPEVVCGLDERAGGTWLGMNGAGVVAVLTNRPGRHDPAAASRGAIVRAALESWASDPGAARAAARAVADQPNPFSLFVGDGTSGVAVLWDGPGSTPDVRALAPGLHTLTNQHDLDALEAADVLARAPGGAVQLPDGVPLAEAVIRLETLAAGHEPLDDTRNAVCVHDEAHGRGTVSSAILAVDAAGGPALFRSAWGRPCEVPFAPVPLPVRSA